MRWKGVEHARFESLYILSTVTDLDLRKSELKPPGDHRIQFSATGDEEFNDVDWTLRLEGIA